MQEEVFEQSTAPLLRRFLNGENCVLFAYGMTNAGKTHTIQGNNSSPGILPRLVTAILDEMARTTTEWDLHVSMLEIYQENIYDLLSKKRKDKLTIRDANGKVEVNKLSTHSVKSTKEACKLMDTAAYNRCVTPPPSACSPAHRGSDRLILCPCMPCTTGLSRPPS